MQIKVTLPTLHDGQLAVKRERRRFNVPCFGRRWGKNILMQDLAVETSLVEGLPFAWCAPTYKMLLDDWGTLCDTLATVTRRRSEQEKRLVLVNGGVLDFWSLEKPNAIRGKKYRRIVVNEAAFVPGLLNIWNLIIRPTLIDLRGDAYFPGTPKGYNDFWTLYNQTGDDWAHWQMSSYANPHIPADELDAMRDTLLERAFQQEIMAQFLEDGGGVFRNVRQAATVRALERAIPEQQYVIGADWGRTIDATVFCVVDVQTGECVHVDRMTDTDYAAQRMRLTVLAEKFNNAAVLVEQNSIGQPQIEQLQREGLAVSGFTTTNATKQQIIDALALAFEQGKIGIVDNDVLIAELMAYQAERMTAGTMRYGAPDGMHDDCVIALALAWWAGGGQKRWYVA